MTITVRIVFNDSVTLTLERVERQGILPTRAEAVTNVCLTHEV